MPAGEPFAREVCVPLAFWMRAARGVDASHIPSKAAPGKCGPGLLDHLRPADSSQHPLGALQVLRQDLEEVVQAFRPVLAADA